MKHIYFFLIFIFSGSVFSQNLDIFFDSQQGLISGFTYKTSEGILYLSASGELKAFVLSDRSEGEFLKEIANINGVSVYATSLEEINYNEAYYIEDAYKDLPISINHTKITYFQNTYDPEAIKGKIKSIGNTKLQYYTAYYDDDLLGKIQSINNLKITYNSDYPSEEMKGLFASIYGIPILYNKSYYKEYLNGKIEAIGRVKIQYFDSHSNTDLNGNFKAIHGEDVRFELHVD